MARIFFSQIILIIGVHIIPLALGGAMAKTFFSTPSIARPAIRKIPPLKQEKNSLNQPFISKNSYALTPKTAALFGAQYMSQSPLYLKENVFFPMQKAFFSLRTGEWAPIISHKITLKELTPSTILEILTQLRAWHEGKFLLEIKPIPLAGTYFNMKTLQNSETIKTFLHAFPRILVDRNSYDNATFFIEYLNQNFHAPLLKAITELPQDAIMHNLIGQIAVENEWYAKDNDWLNYLISNPRAALGGLKILAHHQLLDLKALQAAQSLSAADLKRIRQKLHRQKRYAFYLAKAAAADASFLESVKKLMNLFNPSEHEQGIILKK